MIYQWTVQEFFGIISIMNTLVTMTPIWQFSLDLAEWVFPSLLLELLSFSTPANFLLDIKNIPNFMLIMKYLEESLNLKNGIEENFCLEQWSFYVSTCSSSILRIQNYIQTTFG